MVAETGIAPASRAYETRERAAAPLRVRIVPGQVAVGQGTARKLTRPFSCACSALATALSRDARGWPRVPA